MRTILLTVTALFMLVAAAAGIKCYVCSGTESFCSKSNLQRNDNKLIECGTSMCMRTWLKVNKVVTVVNECSSQRACNLEKASCDKLDDIDGYDCAVGCCSTDACNTGLPVSINVFMLTVSPALGLALMM